MFVKNELQRQMTVISAVIVCHRKMANNTTLEKDNPLRSLCYANWLKLQIRMAEKC
jgi:hypothetical protein